MMSRSQRVRQHASDILRVNRDSVAWVWMAVTGLSTFMPLLIGILRGEAGLSIFGSLTGYFVGLTDSKGTLSHRLLTAITTIVICWLAFVTGISLQTNSIGFVALSGVMVYLLGILGGRGAEFERLLLFAGIDFFVARYAPTVTFSALPIITLYYLITLMTTLTVILISRFTVQKTAADFVSISQALRQFFTRDTRRHFYAITYTCAILCAIVVVEIIKIDRGYWTVITALLLMKPDRKTSLYRIAQRILGTLLGVAVGHLLLMAQPPIFVFLAAVGLCATLVPFVWNRNYWLVSFCATTMVISLLSIAQYGHIDPRITILRVKATLVGCFISAVVIFTFRFIERIIWPPATRPR